MSTSDDLIAQARSMVGGADSAIPRRSQAVVTCMDTRLDPLRIMGASVGDLHVMRNAGGLVTDDVIRSLVLSQHVLRTTRIAVMMHTDCGLLGHDDEALMEKLVADTGQRPMFSLGGFDDLETELRHGIERLAATPWLPHRDAITGSIYDVTTARLHRIL